jgi:hypothetical protein
MKTRPKNIVPFVLRGLPPLDKLDQRLMRKLRKLADRTGWTVEDLIYEGILDVMAKCETEKKLETRIIRLPKARRVGLRYTKKRMPGDSR